MPTGKGPRQTYSCGAAQGGQRRYQRKTKEALQRREGVCTRACWGLQALNWLFGKWVNSTYLGLALGKTGQQVGVCLPSLADPILPQCPPSTPPLPLTETYSSSKC